MTKNKYKILNNPHVLKMFDYENNDPDCLHLSIWKRIKIKWKCQKGHIFEAFPEKIHQGQGCPYCYGRYATKNSNLEKNNPQLAIEWDYDKNKLLPNQVKEKSGKNFYWKCSKGHSWLASPHNRATGQGCPYCINKKTDKSNCLKNNKKYKHILKEWDNNKNTIKPEEITHGSTKKVWWKCKQHGHEWKAQIRQRCLKNSQCPHCNKIEFKSGELFESYTEALYFLELKEQNIQFIQCKKYPNSRMICDFYIPSLKKFIEVTSFNSQKDIIFGDKFFWRKYLKKIAKKKKIAHSHNYAFEFTQKTLRWEDIMKILKYVK